MVGAWPGRQEMTTNTFPTVQEPIVNDLRTPIESKYPFYFSLLQSWVIPSQGKDPKKVGIVDVHSI